MLASLLRPFSLSSRWSSYSISPPGGCQAWFHWLSKFLQILYFSHSVFFYCFSSLCMEVVQSLSTFTLITLWMEPVYPVYSIDGIFLWITCWSEIFLWHTLQSAISGGVRKEDYRHGGRLRRGLAAFWQGRQRKVIWYTSTYQMM